MLGTMDTVSPSFSGVASLFKYRMSSSFTYTFTNDVDLRVYAHAHVHVNVHVNVDLSVTVQAIMATMTADQVAEIVEEERRRDEIVMNAEPRLLSEHSRPDGSAE